MAGGVGSSRVPPRPAGLDPEARAAWEKTYLETKYQELPWFSPRPSPWLVQAVEARWFRRGCEILDIGCGAGTNVLWLARHGFRAAGVDIAPAAISAAERRAQKGGVTARFRVADALALPFRDGSFSAALDSGCFHSLPLDRRNDYVREAGRILRPDSPFLLAWIGREEVRKYGPPHRPSLEEVTSVFEPSFVFARTEFHPSRSNASWKTAGGSLATYTALMIRRRGRQPPLR